MASLLLELLDELKPFIIIMAHYHPTIRGIDLDQPQPTAHATYKKSTISLLTISSSYSFAVQLNDQLRRDTPSLSPRFYNSLTIRP